ncbi:cutinase family protein [Gordonia sp. NPDC057258]|uniref:cutinase family protein n=1 Tax=unclassified Gordonia (in: high G+C Gram-positive bacteria) TaxID=2657482 RepID=UPI003630E4C8
MATTAITDPDYPAYGIDTLIGLAPKYFAGVGHGRNATADLLRRWAADSACDHQQVVLAGYSQGAMVMHQLAAAMWQPKGILPNSDAQIIPRVAGVVLISDPDRTGNDASEKPIEPSPAGRGVDYFFTHPNPNLGLGVLAWKDKVFTLCIDNDPVCAFEGPGDLNDEQFALHSTYEQSPNLATAARAIKLGFADDTPALDQNSLTVTTIKGQTIAHKLRATTGRGCTVQWTVPAPNKMPNGTWLTSGGTISGKPITTGTFRIGVVARSICGPGRAIKSASADITMKVLRDDPAATYGSFCPPGTPLEVTFPPLVIGQPYDEIWHPQFLDTCKPGNQVLIYDTVHLDEFGMQILPDNHPWPTPYDSPDQGRKNFGFRVVGVPGLPRNEFYVKGSPIMANLVLRWCATGPQVRTCRDVQQEFRIRIPTQVPAGF